MVNSVDNSISNSCLIQVVVIFSFKTKFWVCVNWIFLNVDLGFWIWDLQSESRFLLVLKLICRDWAWRFLIRVSWWKTGRVVYRARQRKRIGSSRIWWINQRLIWKKAISTMLFPIGTLYIFFSKNLAVFVTT